VTVNEFIGKIQYEGGIISALEYGLTYEDLDDQNTELARAWKDLERIWDDEFQPAVHAVEDLIPDEAW